MEAAENKTLKNSIKMSFRSIGENVALARLVVAAALAEKDITLAELDEIKVAVSEAVSNAIIHGYENQGQHMVKMEIDIDGDDLTILVQDDGIGIADVDLAMQPTYSSSSERMGLGFSFMQSFMDKVEVTSVLGQGTSVRLMKKLGAFESESIEPDEFMN